MIARTLTVAAATALSLLAGSAFAQQAPTYFSFIETTSYTRAPHEFVVGITDPVMIKRFRDIIDGNYPNKDIHVEGRIIPTRAAYNEEWAFHLDPATVETFTNEIEHCDADPFVVEDNLALVGKIDPDDPDGGFLANFLWCPYNSRLVREVKYPGGGGFGTDK